MFLRFVDLEGDPGGKGREGCGGRINLRTWEKKFFCSVRAQFICDVFLGKQFVMN